MAGLLDHSTQEHPVQVSADLDLLDRCYFSLQPAVRASSDLFSILTPFGSSFFYGESPAEKGFALLDRARERGTAQERTRARGAMDTVFNLRGQAYFNTAEYCSKKGLVDRADHYFSSALQEARSPKLLAHIWLARGDLFFAQKNAGVALSAYRNSIFLYPEPVPYSRLIRSLLSFRNYPGALAEAERATGLFPDNGNAWRELAACEAALGDREKAGRAFQKAVELEKNPQKI
jgi:tetratricopeptide (TPR) repeat protein